MIAIRTRYKSYKDYGFAEGEAQALENAIQSDGFSNDDLLRQCCEKANAGISGFLFRSLREGISYDRMSYCDCVPIGKSDFYAYRRLALNLFRQEKGKKLTVFDSF